MKHTGETYTRILIYNDFNKRSQLMRTFVILGLVLLVKLDFSNTRVGHDSKNIHKLHFNFYAIVINYHFFITSQNLRYCSFFKTPPNRNTKVLLTSPSNSRYIQSLVAPYKNIPIFFLRQKLVNSFSVTIVIKNGKKIKR